MRRSLAILALIVVIMGAGCLNKLSGGSMFEQNYEASINRTPIFSPNMSDQCKIGACVCLVCKNGTNIFGPLESLIGGYCYWDMNCTPDETAKIEDKNKTPDYTIRHFMLGQGPTFSDFAIANTYCSDRLSMAVQWLIGTNDTPYPMPDAQRAMCMLSKDVIPVYILYSNGTNINLTQSRNIGTYLGTQGKNLFNGILSQQQVGPVIVVTEMNFNITLAPQVAQQVLAIDQGCGNNRPTQINCFIAVAPKFNDYAALDEVMKDLGPNRDKVDLVAYGIDGQYAHSCDASKIRLQALNFSSYSLYNYSKPTIIPYVMFDLGSNDTDNSCTWDEPSMDAAYGSFFPTNILALQKRGVIGIAPYAFNTTGGYGITNPLGCNDCAVARTSGRMSWYAGCQAYTYVTKGNTGNPSGQTLIIFGNESGSVCNQNANFDYMVNVNYQGLDIMQSTVPALKPPVNLTFSCDACLVNNITRSLTDMFPSLTFQTGKPPDIYCGSDGSFPEINQWAGARNLDPMMVRAFVLTESNFSTCSAAKVCSKAYLAAGGAGSGCVPPTDSSGNSECYSNAYDEMYDPAGNCTPYLPIAPDSGTPTPSWRYCAMGLFQNIEPPFTFWPAPNYPDGTGNGPYFDVFQRSGFYQGGMNINNAKSCNPHYNPFNPGDSACLGTLKIQQMYNQAQGIIKGSILNSGDSDKNNVLAVWVTAELYTGFWGAGGATRNQDPHCASSMSNGDCWLYSFGQNLLVNATYCQDQIKAGTPDTQRCTGGQPKYQPPDVCYGQPDFFKFLNDCEVPYLYRGSDPGQEKLKAYFWLNNYCPNSMCPDGKTFYNLACANDNGQVNSKLCAGAGMPNYPTSGTPYIPNQQPMPQNPPPGG